MTMGEWMLYGGLAGAVVCVVTVLIALRVFSWRRKRLLKKIMENL